MRWPNTSRWRGNGKLSATGKGGAWSGYLARDKSKSGLDLPSPSGLAEPSFPSIA